MLHCHLKLPVAIFFISYHEYRFLTSEFFDTSSQKLQISSTWFTELSRPNFTKYGKAIQHNRCLTSLLKFLWFQTYFYKFETMATGVKPTVKISDFINFGKG